jgi:hypothetical protein
MDLILSHHLNQSSYILTHSFFYLVNYSEDWIHANISASIHTFPTPKHLAGSFLKCVGSC